MQISHAALWTKNLEQLKDFYVRYFDGHVGAKYYNSKKNFESYFLSFDGGAKLEIMRKPDIVQSADNPANGTGLDHIAFSAGSRQNVDLLTNQLRNSGYRVFSEPRVTGDGYYESCILDPDGNKVEITE